MTLVRLAALPLVLTGCLDHLFDAPFVLATGLGQVDGLVPTIEGSLLAATPTGLFEVDEAGGRTRLTDQPAQAVTAHTDRVVVLSGDTLLHAAYPLEQPATWERGPTVPGAVDVLSWCEGAVLVATSTDVWVWTPGEATLTPWGVGLSGITRLALRPEPTCAGALVVTESAVVAVGPGSAAPLVGGLTAPRAACIDGAGQIWVVAGAPPVLSVVTDGKPQVFAKHLDEPTDVHFGVGRGVLPENNLYISDKDGTITYVHVPVPGQASGSPPALGGG